MPSYIIETSGLTRRFGRLSAVDGVDLKVPAGSVYGFLGPNGAGKTTTIRMLLGLIRPTAGSIRLLGSPLDRNRMGLLSQIGSLVESPSLYPNLTGWENLELIRRLRGGTRTQIERALTLVNLDADAGRVVSQYSLGMCQRLGLAIALLTRPALLILDEPTNGLDPAGIHEIRELIRRLPGEAGVTVFLSSHLLNEVEQMASHIGIIREGRLIFQGTPDQLRSQYADHVLISVDRIGEAGKMLVQGGWQVGRPSNGNGDGYLRVTANGRADAAMLAAQLTGSGYHLYHISLEQPSLEDIFLQITRGQVKMKGAI